MSTPSSPTLAASTAASSPPLTEDDHSRVDQATPPQQFQDRFARLERLLDKSFTYSNLLGAQMDKEKRTSALRAAMHVASDTDTNTGTRKRAARKPPKRRVPESDDDASPDKPSLEPVGTDAQGVRHTFLQPALVTGGTLKEYQLEGVEWMVSLDKNGVSGILGPSCPSSSGA